MRVVPLLVAVALLGYAFARRRLRGEAALALSAGLVAGVYGLGVFGLPNAKDAIKDAGDTLGPWTYLLVAALAFLETGAFVGLVAPGETAIVLGGVVAGQGEIDLVALIALVWACAVAGDATSFFLGRRLDRDFLLRHGPRFRMTHERLEMVEDFFDRHGGKTILIGRFIGPVRAMAPFIAGASNMPYRRFWPYGVLGAGVWATLYCTLGYVFWQSFDEVASYAAQGTFALGTVVVGGVAALLVQRRLADDERRAETRAWLHEQARRPALRPVAAVCRPMVFGVLEPIFLRLRRPARFTWERLTPGDLGLELTSLVAAVAVGVYALVGLGLAIDGPTDHMLGDQRALAWADDIRSGALDDVVRAITHLGDGHVVWLVGLAAAAMAFARRNRIDATVLVLALPVLTTTTNVLKAAFDRDRPFDRLVETHSASFPSGHAANSVVWLAAAIVLGRAIPSLAGRVAVLVVAVVIGLAVGASRVYLRAHWVSDVVAGWGMGVAVLGLAGIAGLVVGHLRNNGPSEVPS